MASRETNARLRIPLALAVIALAAASLFMIWRPEIELWFRISGSLLCAILLLWTVMILGGKTKSGRLLLTRRRWKYFIVLGVVVAATITIAVIAILAAQPDQYSPLLSPLLQMLLGLFVAHLYEPEGPPLFKAPDLSDRDARAWKRAAIVLAIIGISLGCIAVIAGATGNIYALPFLLPIVVMLLIIAAALWTILRTRKRHGTNP
jgi:peptidoglycan/LPS O-acetylase OafA/YrhL